jgi:hypothetical protein
MVVPKGPADDCVQVLDFGLAGLRITVRQLEIVEEVPAQIGSQGHFMDQDQGRRRIAIDLDGLALGREAALHIDACVDAMGFRIWKAVINGRWAQGRCGQERRGCICKGLLDQKSKSVVHLRCLQIQFVSKPGSLGDDPTVSDFRHGGFRKHGPTREDGVPLHPEILLGAGAEQDEKEQYCGHAYKIHNCRAVWCS